MVVRGAGTAIVLAHVLCLGACIAFAATRDLSNGAAAEPADAAEEAEAPDAAGCEGALSSNCGTCNRDCGGEPCVAGECAVTVLASKQLAPIAIARDATRVYWTSYDKDLGAVMACDKAGCNDTPTVIADHEGGPSALAIAGDRVFWSDVDTAQVRCRPFDADAGPPTTVTNSVTVSFSLVFAGNVLHFGDDTYGGVRSLTQWSLDGCRSYSSAAGSDLQPSPRSIVVGTSLGYWISGGEIRAWALDSTPASTIVTNQPSAYALAVDLFAVYWTTESGTVMSAPLDPKLGAPTTLASGLNHPLAIAASDSEIYFTTVGTGAGMIAKVSKSGGPVTVIASKRKRPVALAVDERYVYWTDAEPGYRRAGAPVKRGRARASQAGPMLPLDR